MKENHVCITMVFSTEENLDLQKLFMSSFERYVDNIKLQNNSIIIKFFDNTIAQINIADREKTKIQMLGMEGYYSRINIENKEVLKNLITQFQISNNLLYFHFDITKDELRTQSIIASLYSFIEKVGGILIFPNLSIFNSKGELVISSDGKSNVESFYASAKTTKVISDNLEFSSEDKDRIEKNIGILSSNNIPYNKNMKLIPSKSNTKLCDREIIFSNLIIDFLLASMSATFPFEVDMEQWNNIYSIITWLYPVEPYMSDDDKKILDDIKNNRPIDKTKLTWLYEKCAISMWVLGLWDFPNQYSECDVNRMNEILYHNEKNKDGVPDLFMKILIPNTDELDLDRLNMRSYEEILEKADLLNRYKWACDEAMINNTNINFKISMPVLTNQLSAFYDILNWDPNIPISNVR